VEVAGSEDVTGLVGGHLLDVVRPLARQLQRRLERFHSCTSVYHTQYTAVYLESRVWSFEFNAKPYLRT